MIGIREGENFFKFRGQIAMFETNQIISTLKDLRVRADLLRGYL